MNTRNFKCFQTLYEERNLQVAAAKLFLSPQGLSKLIKNLEEECTTPLFVRTKDGFIPTEAGKVFYEKSLIVSRDISEMFTAMEAVNDREKRFRIGFAAGTIGALDIPTIDRIMKAHPEIVASWNEKANDIVLKRVLNDEINCGLVVGMPEEPGLAKQLVRSSDMVVYVYNGHRLWDAEHVSMRELRDERFVSMNEDYRIYHDVLNACHMNNFHPNLVGRMNDGLSFYHLVKNHIGIGIAPRFFEDTEYVRAVQIDDACTWDVYGIYKENSLDTQLAKHFLDQL